MATGETDPHATSRGGPGGTPQGHTPEGPAPDEFGEPGTPAAGLTPNAPHAADADELPDRHSVEHAEAPFGPIDWGAWAVSICGVAAGSLVALVLALVIQHG